MKQVKTLIASLCTKFNFNIYFKVIPAWAELKCIQNCVVMTALIFSGILSCVPRMVTSAL